MIKKLAYNAPLSPSIIIPKINEIIDVVNKIPKPIFVIHYPLMSEEGFKRMTKQIQAEFSDEYKVIFLQNTENEFQSQLLSVSDLSEDQAADLINKANEQLKKYKTNG